MSDDVQQPDTPAAGTFEAVVETIIETIVTGGAGLARLDEGRIAFVPGTAPGERVRARIVREKKGFVEAELVEVLEPSPDRVDPPLGELGSLSGCDLQHLSIDAQRRAKTDIVRDCFRRQGGMDLEDRLEAPAPAGPELGYRNKVRITRDPAGRWGVIRKGSNDVMPIETHGLMPDLFNDVILPWARLLPPVDQIVVRLDGTGGWLASLYGPPTRAKALKTVFAESAPPENCVGVIFNNRPLWGRDHLLIKLAGRTWRVHHRSFFQTNVAETESAVKLAGNWLDDAGFTAEAPSGVLVDLYGGVGLFGLALGDRFAKVIGVEENRQAVFDARNNYKRAAALASRAKVVQAPVEKVTLGWKMTRAAGADGSGRPPQARATGPFSKELAFAAQIGAKLDFGEAVFVVDPPRTGLGERVTNDLVALAPGRILYMSCDPATLARDCGALAKGGYVVKRARVVDMFPMTSHVETLVELEKDEIAQL